MIGILPGRLATRQRLIVGALLVLGVSLLQLIGLELGPFGSVWPVALLWPVCGWTGLGPNVSTACLLFVLGLWVDILTGAPLGSWAIIALTCHGIVLVLARFVGISGLPRFGQAIVSAIVMLVMMILFSLWRGNGFDLLGSLLPLIVAIGCYQFLGRLFELKEDET